VKENSHIRDKLFEIGVLRLTGHLHLAGCITLPIINEQGQVLELYGRRIGYTARDKASKHLYLARLPGQSIERGVWNLPGLKGHKSIILCEALFDALSFWKHGFHAVTSSYGTAGFSEQHLACFKTLGIETVKIAYDNDEAGNKAAAKVSEILFNQGICAERVLFAPGEDANSTLQKADHPQHALQLALENAEIMPLDMAPIRKLIDRLPNPPKQKTSSSASENPPAMPPQPPNPKALPDNRPSAVLAPDTERKEETKEKKSPRQPPSLAASEDLPPLQKGEGDDKHLYFIRGERNYRIGGLTQKSDNLKISLLLRSNSLSFVDRIDLYSAKQRQAFVKNVEDEMGLLPEIVKKDLGQLLLSLEQEQLAQQQARLKADAPMPMTKEERQAALDFLKSEKLMQRIQKDVGALGVVGEDMNMLTGFLACTSRKLNKPLAIIIKSTSSAGKSSLMNALLSLFPEEEQVLFSAMTGQSLFYMGETTLKYKILAIGEEEGMQQASYSLKMLQSEGVVTIACTCKDPDTGLMTTKEYRVEGPIMLFITSAASFTLDEELENRHLVMTLNESPEQTLLIQDAQRRKRTLAGIQEANQKSEILPLYRNAQRLLKSVPVLNPFADQLKFIHKKTRHRRDNEKYLTLIDSIALLHQHQRPLQALLSEEGVMKNYVPVLREDIALGNQIAHEILGHTLDELSPQTRKLLLLIYALVQQHCQEKSLDQRDYRFSRKTIRDETGWSDSQLKLHCKRLQEMEYLLVHRGRRGLCFEYELLYDNADGKERHCMGLLDINDLKDIPECHTAI
jgi:hypothetical protein